jgi:hypothetical protein
MEVYQKARSEAGRDADSHVRLALWCERHGLTAERLQHLALAVLADPSHPTARGLLGLVAVGDGWRKPVEVAARSEADPAGAASLAEYRARRATTRMTADAQWGLALWCERNGLKSEADAHLTAVVRLDPSREAAWKRLGCRKFEGRWLTPDQIEEVKAERSSQARADRLWSPRLAKWKDQLGDERKRQEAEQALAGVDDPRAVPSVWRVFVQEKGADHLRATRLLSQVDGPAASRSLAWLAVFGGSTEARRAATESLLWRDPREFVGSLIGLIRPAIDYEVTHVEGPGSPGVLQIRGPEGNLRRVYAPQAPADTARPGDFLAGFDENGQPIAGRVLGFWTGRFLRQGTEDPFFNDLLDPLGWSGPVMTGLPDTLARTPLGEAGRSVGERIVANQKESREIQGRIQRIDPDVPGRVATRFDVTWSVLAEIPVGTMLEQARRAAMTAEQQLQADVAVLDQFNAQVGQVNERVLPLLRTVTGQDHDDDPKAWTRWWTDFQGYSFREQPTTPTEVTQVIPVGTTPPPVQIGLGPVVAFQAGTSCFAAGTPVHTPSGTRPIETLRIGDQVLSRDVLTGALRYEPTLAVYHNPPDQTLRIAMGGRDVVATPIHRFWKAGVGWVMARDLKPGDSVRTINGLARVDSIEPAGTRPVFNLEVAVNRSFFVGEAGLLVHDNSLVRPVDQPFDASPELAKASGD